jgi:hypothetical protein
MPLAWIFHKCVTNLVYDVSLLRRIASRCMAVLSSTGFSLCTVNGPQLKPHRLKPVLLDRDGPPLSLLAVNPAGNLHRVHVGNVDLQVREFCRGVVEARENALEILAA